eukprot:TRINITY_DN17453_c0_g1_i1.p1 TRINITY_DN17453_c0_g1~~TRINITY_DN17453_c0_g1_i1.p1  ORF type:complete len:259 (-),score=55.18 TRINITY_DN17453_c0_g1_i1:157-933(-)
MELAETPNSLFRMHSVSDESPHMSWNLDSLYDEDQKLHRRSFAIRKLCFLFYIIVTLSVAAKAPSLHPDLAFWAFVLTMTYYSLDIESDLNGPFIAVAHPISYQMSMISLVTGIIVVASHPSIVRERAAKDDLDLTAAWVLHACCYWVPSVMIHADALVSSSYLRRRYFLVAEWPVTDLVMVAKILWIWFGPTLLMIVWGVVGHSPSSSYDGDEVKLSPLAFYSILQAVAFLNSLPLIAMVRYRSEYGDARFDLSYAI